MTATLLFRLQDGKIRVLEETIESWKQDHEQAMLAQDMEDLVAACLSGWEDIRRLWARTRKLAARNQLANLHDTGLTLQSLLDRQIRLLATISARAESVAHNTGHAIEGQEDLSEAMREVRGLHDHIANAWPWEQRPVLPLNRKMVEESRAARARGESRDVTDLLAGLKAGNSPSQT